MIVETQIWNRQRGKFHAGTVPAWQRRAMTLPNASGRYDYTPITQRPDFDLARRQAR